MEWKRDPENGYLIGPDGCHYPNVHQVYHFALLKQCGCGVPEQGYNFCRDVLALCDRRDESKWIDAPEAIAKLIAEKPAEAADVLMHFLTHLDLLEHGGGVGGSWLTDAGKAIVDLRPATTDDMDAEEPDEESSPR